ncbi:MAG: DUF6940 family protein [Algiphilus sp.]
MSPTTTPDWQLLAQQRHEDAPMRLQLFHKGEAIGLAAGFVALARDGACRHAFNAALARSPFAAFRWEFPPLPPDAVSGAAFECTLINAPELMRPANPSAFAEHLKARPGESVTTFDNLGGDARLVVPLSLAEQTAYAHLAAFVRSAPEAQRDAFWQQLGSCVQQACGDAPLWVSTAGDGVPWLHARLDQRPKYFRTEAYRHLG